MELYWHRHIELLGAWIVLTHTILIKMKSIPVVVFVMRGSIRTKIYDIIGKLQPNGYVKPHFPPIHIFTYLRALQSLSHEQICMNKAAVLNNESFQLQCVFGHV